MWHEQAGAALTEAAQDVLETMCFVAAEEVPAPLSLGVASIAAQVEFRGHWNGRCMVEMPESCARIIAGNFTAALDSNHVETLNMIELLCEFANMICGSTITRLQCPGLVALAPPHLIWEWPRRELHQGQPVIERWMDTGEGVVRIGFETEDKA